MDRLFGFQFRKRLLSLFPAVTAVDSIVVRYVKKLALNTAYAIFFEIHTNTWSFLSFGTKNIKI